MVPELNPDLINNFRGKVHDHDDFIRLYFADYKTKNSIEGKDIWSKICACMDLLLSDLKSIIPAYQKAIQEVEWYEDDVFELFNMRSQIHLDNHYDFSKVLEYAGGSSNSSSGETSLRILIGRGLLPRYFANLAGPSLSLLIHALDHERNKTNPRKIKKKYDIVQIIDDISDPPVILTLGNSGKG